jgi:ribosomal-protein-alanine N-acetyltransferase
MPNSSTPLPIASQDLPYFVTPRLVVRVAGANDLDAIVRYVTENAAFLQPWEPIRPVSYYSAAYWRIQISRDSEDVLQDRGVRLFLFDRESTDAKVCGVATFGNLVRGAAQYCTLGYAIAESAQGKGLMREALEEAAIPYIFETLGLHRIHANYLPRNERSGGLLRRLGFSVEGYARDYLLINGRWEDHILTSRTNPGWKPVS